MARAERAAPMSLPRLTLLCTCWAWPAVAVAVSSGGTSSGEAAVGRRGLGTQLRALAARSFTRSLAFKHRLRICNAFPDRGAVDVSYGSERLTPTPMRYKECREFAPEMRAGDKLKFKVAGKGAGSFAVSELPGADAVLLLVVFRRDEATEAVAFESHVFTKLINAQIAVLDAYRGSAKSSARIEDPNGAKNSRSEELRYDSVVALNPGIYEVVLQTDNGEPKDSRELVALNRESYVVVRCGVEPHDGSPAYPEELVVFPHSDPEALLGAALGRGGALGSVLSAAMLWTALLSFVAAA